MMPCPLHVSLNLNYFVDWTNSFLISRESILKFDIINTIAFRFFIDMQANQICQDLSTIN